MYLIVCVDTVADRDWSGHPRSAAWLACGLCTFLTLENVIYANGAPYLPQAGLREHTRWVYTIMAKVEDLPGYVEEGPGGFSGDLRIPTSPTTTTCSACMEEGGDRPSGSAITYDGTIKWWFGNIMGAAPSGQHTGGTRCLGRKSCCAGHAQLPRQRLHCHGGWCGCN